MIRFAWIRFRTQAAVGAGLLTIAAIALLVTGIQLAHAYDAAAAVCKQQGNCARLLTSSSRRATSRRASYWGPSASPSPG
jgi:hypothetical protein